MPALRKVRPPAFLLLCVGSLNIVICLLALAAMFLGFRLFPLQGAEAAAAAQEQVTWPVILTAFGSMVAGALTIWGALSALNLRSWGLVTVGAITALLPLGPTCCLGLPFAAWMFWVLSMPEVKQHFT
jgi:hypothetical protein